jgi:hypothetical protein
MYKKSLEAVQATAAELPSAPVVVLSGVILTARHCYDVLAAARGPMVAQAVADQVSHRTGRLIGAETVRQILRALQAGGLPIESLNRKGYQLKR